jgi:hypothetical protein
MGIAVEMAGRKVRCPHCKQVVQAPPLEPPRVKVTPPLPPPKPTPAPIEESKEDSALHASSGTMPVVSIMDSVVSPKEPADSSEVVGKPPEMPPKAEVKEELTEFTFASRGGEAADSILSDPDESEDEVFSSTMATRLIIPDLPPLPKLTPTVVAQAPPRVEPEPDATNPFEFPSSDLPPLPPPPPGELSQIANLSSPLSDELLSSESGSIEVSPTTNPSMKPVAPELIPVTTQLSAFSQPVVESNSWQGFETASAEVKSPELAVVAIPHEPEKRSYGTRSREESPEPSTSGGKFKILFFVVSAYAAIATLVAIYAFFFAKPNIDPGHPLSTMPDNWGDFPPAERKKIGQGPLRADGDLPPQLRVAMGQKLTVGQLEIEPIQVELRKLNLKMRSQAGDVSSPYPGEPDSPALVLKLRLKNTSDDVSFCPIDPAFTRKEVKNDPIPLTGLMLPGRSFWGGPVPWPMSRDNFVNKSVGRICEDDQVADSQPLLPGQTREYIVFSSKNPDLIRAVRASKDTIEWRLQLRRGLIELNGHDVPVTALIGVDFQAADIKNEA